MLPRNLDSAELGNRETPAGCVVLPSALSGEGHVYNQFVIRVASTCRDGLRETLKKQGIETAVYYPLPLNCQPVARQLGYSGTECPRAVIASRECVSLPICPELGREQQRRVVSAVAAFFGS